MSSSDLTLEEDKRTCLGDDVSSKLRKQEIDHMNIALVDLRMVCLEMAFGGLRASLSGTEYVG